MKLPQNKDWILRPATLADIYDVCEIINAHSLAVLGTANDAKRDVEMTWGQPDFQMETDTRVVITPEGRIAGYAEVSDTREPHVQLRSWVRVHPDFQNLGCAYTLTSKISVLMPGCSHGLKSAHAKPLPRRLMVRVFLYFKVSRTRMLKLRSCLRIVGTV